MGKGTWSRLIIVSTPDDEARNMRTLGVMSKNTRTGKWHLVNRLQTLPAGFYVSPTYSTLLEGAKKARGEKSTAHDFASPAPIPEVAPVMRTVIMSAPSV